MLTVARPLETSGRKEVRYEQDLVKFFLYFCFYGADVRARGWPE
jgi:hypothetical protein